jgi:hypothetical protein
MSGPRALDMARRMSGGYGTGEGHVGLVERSDPADPPAPCDMCPDDAVLYFVTPRATGKPMRSQRQPVAFCAGRRSAEIRRPRGGRSAKSRPRTAQPA